VTFLAFIAVVPGIIYLSQLFDFKLGFGAALIVGLLLTVSRYRGPRRLITEIDMVNRRFRISRRNGGYLLTIVDRPLGMCASLGVTKDMTAHSPSYRASVELKDGKRHAITLRKSSPGEATWVVSQLSDATGLPVRDIVIAES
jgi:hypothetical protein